MKDSQTTPKYKKCCGRNWRLQELMDVADSFDVQMTMEAETKANTVNLVQRHDDDVSIDHLSVEFRMKGDGDECNLADFHLKRNSKRMSPFLPVLTLLLITTVIGARTILTGGDEGNALVFSRHLKSPKQNTAPSPPVPPPSTELSDVKPTLPSFPTKIAVNKPSEVRFLFSQSTLSSSPSVSSAPSVSANPSTIPTVSSAPSVSLYPSTAPSLSVAPTLSWSRSGTVTPPQQYPTPAPIWDIVSTGAPSPRATFETTAHETPSYETPTAPFALPVPTNIRTARPVASPTSDLTPETTNETPTSEIAQPTLQYPVASPVAAPVSKPTAVNTNETPSGETANEKTSAPVQLLPDAVPSVPPVDNPTSEGEVPTNGDDEVDDDDDDDMPTDEDDYVAPDVDDDGFVNPSPTKAPVARPTPTPVAQPVDNPTASPTATTSIPETPVPDTQTPVVAPTRSPSRSITNDGDSSPVALPTREPPVPTPTRDPPVPAPTRDPPVSMPTRDPPVSMPTRDPPVSMPTRDPPVPAPTRDPPPRPTAVRTRAPVSKPVAPPVSRPTAPVANNTPTRRPAAQPVTQDKPFVSSSLPPTFGPSPQPSLVPSVSPSGSPSVSFQPTSSTAPSAIPTPSFLYEKMSLLSERIVVLAKFDSRRLQEEEVPYRALCVRPVEEFVANSVRNEVEEVVQTIETLDVFIQNTTKELNIEKLAISYTFDVLIEIRSFLTVHDMRRYIGGPFDSQDEKDAFVRFLRSTSCPELDQVTSVEIILPTELALADGGTKSSESVIVGILVGIAAIALLAGTFVFSVSRNRRKQAQLAEQMNQEEHTGSYPKPAYEAHDYMSEIGLQTVQDMSSLGDPIPPGVSGSLADFATLEPRSIDYDFREAYLERPEASIVSHSYETSSRCTSPVLIADADDVTLNAQYAICEKWEIMAPSGFLGLVLETNGDGSPVVKSIRESSVLFDQVNIGDILVSIDGQDVSFMLASEVSRLIGAKQDQQYRKMVFIRPA